MPEFSYPHRWNHGWTDGQGAKTLIVKLSLRKSQAISPTHVRRCHAHTHVYTDTLTPIQAHTYVIYCTHTHAQTHRHINTNTHKLVKCHQGVGVFLKQDVVGG